MVSRRIIFSSVPHYYRVGVLLLSLLVGVSGIRSDQLLLSFNKINNHRSSSSLSLSFVYNHRLSSTSQSSSSQQLYHRCRHFRPLFSSLGFSSPLSEDEDEEEKDDTSNRWERMYMEGEKDKARLIQQKEKMLQSDGVIPSSNNNNNDNNLRSEEVRVITFDLDNTLWNTKNTISLANDALAKFLTENDIQQPKRVEQVMGELFKASKATYCPQLQKQKQLQEALVSTKEKDSNIVTINGGTDTTSNNNEDDDNNAKKIAPVLLTKLRKDAIRYVLETHNDYTAEETTTEEFADRAFREWMDARYEAISNNLASGVAETLEYISTQIKPSNGQKVVIGAITDGNSDPTSPALQKIIGKRFDFVVNAESVGITKPNKKIYLESMKRHLVTNPALQDIFGKQNSWQIDDDNVLVEVDFEESIGPWWVHIGDDFTKDIVAAKSLNMRTIWSRGLLENYNSSSKQQKPKNNNNNGSYVDEEKKLKDFIKRVSEKEVVEMTIGSDNYLVDSIHREFADVILDGDDFFPQIGRVLLDWHKRGLQATEAKQKQKEKQQQVTEENIRIQQKIENNMLLQQQQQQQQQQEQQKQQQEQEEPSYFEDKINVPTEKKLRKFKFCMSCGDKLPMKAKFCSSCGDKQ